MSDNKEDKKVVETPSMDELIEPQAEEVVEKETKPTEEAKASEEVKVTEELPPTKVDCSNILKVNPDADYSDPSWLDTALKLPTEYSAILTRNMSNLTGRNNKAPVGEKEAIRWLNSVRASDNLTAPIDDYKESVIFKEDSDWASRAVDGDGNSVSPGVISHNPSKGVVAGSEAQLNLQNVFGFGQRVNIPLWTTGIYLRMKTPMIIQRTELEHRLLDDKIELGNLTMGSGISYSAHWFLTQILNTAFDHVMGSTNSSSDQTALEDIIYVTDIPQIIWGLSTTIWPNGYDVGLPCVSNPIKCMHITQAKLNLKDMSKVDRSSLSDKQLTHLLDRAKVKTPEQIKAYQEEHKHPLTRRIKLKDNIYFTFKVPTISEYRVAGQRWVNSLTSNADNIVGKPTEDNAGDRLEYLERLTIDTHLRLHSCWIESIEQIDDDGEVVWQVVDHTSIEENLTDMSSNDDFAEIFLNTIDEFKRSVTINVIGINRITCPSCNNEPDEDSIKPNLPEFIELDIAAMLFTLLCMRG